MKRVLQPHSLGAGEKNIRTITKRVGGRGREGGKGEEKRGEEKRGRRVGGVEGEAKGGGGGVGGRDL